MSRWFLQGIRTGVVTTRYPTGKEDEPGISPGLPETMQCEQSDCETVTARCPVGALRSADNRVVVERARCVHCLRCIRGTEEPLAWDQGFEWASLRDGAAVLPRSFRRSVHIRVIDTGDCGACLNEVKLINNPYYNMHRLGFFITPSPRKADVLLVVGPVTDHMKGALVKAYEAMPSPKRVMAVGACALRGGVFGPGFVTEAGVGDIVPVDLEIPGCPPPPLAILHGLLVLADRKDGVRTTEVASSGAPTQGEGQ